MYRIGFVVLAVLAILAGLAVGTLNADRVTLDLLWLKLHWPLGLLLLLALAAGVLVGFGLSWLFQVLPLKVRQRRRSPAEVVAGRTPEPPDA